ncbi:hypothetical protein [Fodinibius sediminis]|uniref:Uncharacterized protein n=1 Tax=Fodinibius sediminis TaxID=1214077 RepID=A0A521D6M0_9BACT|nr:hypothetical protein [Fodinibius sediminis]SMO66530.1 hypothetical protein SAMN06265218_108125 [Fodinibius sediminis]
MDLGHRTVPFEITGVSHGLKEVKGLIKSSPSGLELEYKLVDGFVGVLESEMKSVHIPFGSLEDITFEKGWFSGKIILEGTSMRAFQGLPGTEPGSRTLKIKRKDREEAQNLVSRARMQLSEYRLNEIEGGEEKEF